MSIEVPAGWEARIVRRPESAPYLHLASFSLHGDAGQFGAAVTGRMGPDSAFAALVEYLVDSDVRPGAGLFASRWRPRLGLHEFRHNQLQVTRPGHLGLQRFFTAAERPYCLYAVIVPVRAATGPARRRAVGGAQVGRVSPARVTLDANQPGGGGTTTCWDWTAVRPSASVTVSETV